jgi:hypothetical protein
MNCEEFSGASMPAFSRSTKGCCCAAIKGTKHFNFCDFSLWTNTPFWKLIGFTGAIDGYRMEQILTDITVSFFEKNLKGNVIDLNAIAKTYPEIAYREKN